MKRAVVLVGFTAVLFACRALVGIDDLEFQPGQPNNNGTSGNGGGGGGDFPPTGCVDAGADCRKCCKDHFDEFRQTFETRPEGLACLCGDAGASCAQACASALCSTSGPTDQPDRACTTCTDQLLSVPGASGCGSACKSRECNDGLQCMQLCGGNKP